MIYKGKKLPLNFSNHTYEVVEQMAKENYALLVKIDKEAQEKRQLLYRFFSVPVGDGRAYYQVTAENVNTVTVRRCDDLSVGGYSDPVLGAHANLNKEQAWRLVGQEALMSEILS